MLRKMFKEVTEDGSGAYSNKTIGYVKAADARARKLRVEAKARRE